MFRRMFQSRPRPATLDLLTRQDDRLLADIGMSRADLESVLHRPLQPDFTVAELMLRQRA